MGRWLTALPLMLGCSFDATGRGSDDGAAGSDAGGDTADGGTENDGGTGDDGGTDPGGDGGSCSFRQIIPVIPANVVTPMQTMMDPIEGTVAFSEVENDGTVSFQFQAPCPGTYFIWGRVLDQDPGTGMFDPDSFNVSVDGDGGRDWFYGCGTQDMTAGWTWQRVHGGMEGGSCDDVMDTSADLGSGPHQIHVRNREEAWFEQHAAIARVLVASDASMGPGPGD